MAIAIIFPEEDGVWWPLRPSKPLAAGVPGRGRFDSSPFRLFYPYEYMESNIALFFMGIKNDLGCILSCKEL